MAGAEFPEGYILLFLLFFFPFMIARKGKIHFDLIIQEYMADTEVLYQKLYIKLRYIYFNIGYVIITYKQKFINSGVDR